MPVQAPRNPLCLVAALLVCAGVGAVPRAWCGGAAQAEGEGITLRYQFPPGRVSRQQSTMKADLQAELEGIAGRQPLTLETAALLQDTVVQVGAAGDALLATELLSFSLDGSLTGVRMVIRMANGKVNSTLNGRPVQGGLLMAALGSGRPRPARHRMSASGQILERGDGDWSASVTRLLGVEGGPLDEADVDLTFPDRPVAVGDRWGSEVTRVIVLPNAPEGASTRLQVLNASNLQRVEERQGRRVAIIETRGGVRLLTPAGGNPPRFTQETTVTTTFDVTAGEVIESRGTIRLDMDLRPLHPAPPAAPRGTRRADIPLALTGTIQVATTKQAAR